MLLVTIYISTIAIYAIAVSLHAASALGGAGGLGFGAGGGAASAPPRPTGAWSLVASIAFEAMVAFVCVAMPICMYLHGRGKEAKLANGDAQEKERAQSVAAVHDRIWLPQHSQHALVPSRHARNLCDLCGAQGTDFRCSAGCDYDACASCCEAARVAGMARSGHGEERGGERSEEPQVRGESEKASESASAQPGSGRDASEDLAPTEQSEAEQWLFSGASSKVRLAPTHREEEDDLDLVRTVSAGDAAAGCGAAARRNVPARPPGRMAPQGAWPRDSQPNLHNAGGHANYTQHPQQWQGGSRFWPTGPAAYDSGFGNPAPQFHSL